MSLTIDFAIHTALTLGKTCENDSTESLLVEGCVRIGIFSLVSVCSEIMKFSMRTITLFPSSRSSETKILYIRPTETEELALWKRLVDESTLQRITELTCLSVAVKYP